MSSCGSVPTTPTDANQPWRGTTTHLRQVDISVLAVVVDYTADRRRRATSSAADEKRGAGRRPASTVTGSAATLTIILDNLIVWEIFRP
jgi:hypothetical protein